MATAISTTKATEARVATTIVPVPCGPNRPELVSVGMEGEEVTAAFETSCCLTPTNPGASSVHRASDASIASAVTSVLSAVQLLLSTLYLTQIGPQTISSSADCAAV